MIRGYSARDLGPGSAALQPSWRTEGRSLVRDRRPRWFPGVSRYGTFTTYARDRPLSMGDPSRTGGGDGRARPRTIPGRRYQVPGGTTGTRPPAPHRQPPREP